MGVGNLDNGGSHVGQLRACELSIGGSSTVRHDDDNNDNDDNNNNNDHGMVTLPTSAAVRLKKQRRFSLCSGINQAEATGTYIQRVLSIDHHDFKRRFMF